MLRALRLTYYLLFFSVLFSCDENKTLFIQRKSSHTNINFSNNLSPTSDLNILNYLYYYNGGGVAAADYNGDDLIDLYFTSNQEQDKLYLNRGDFKFTEVTKASKIKNSKGWTTGVSNIDINNDGRMDLYICKVSGLINQPVHNLLYINKGNDANGNPLFSEEAEKYGLDFSGLSTQSAFFDYDLDGDLDMFLLNHSTHPNKNYGRGEKRETYDSKAGDRLYRNDGEYFTDVSQEAKIFQGVTGYGLGIGIGDLNNDGYPDIYIGNDFFENDYVYINQKDGTFEDIISNYPERFGHTSHYSMGNDIADINNDGYTDIISLDMLPGDLETYKTSGLEFPFQTYSNYLRNGFSPQYMQNSLHLNQGNLNFSETAFLSGVAATEWSWGALFADFNNDSHKDLFITNGIPGATNDMDYIKFISNEKIQRQLNSGSDIDLSTLTKELPEKKVRNFIFQNNGNATFIDKSDVWFPDTNSFSHGSIYADLDNDGDLDLVVNNTNNEAGVFENTWNSSDNSLNYLKVKLKGSENNYFGIGSKVTVYTKHEIQVQEHYLSRGYLSSLAPGMHFGLGNYKKVDSVKVVWFDGSSSLKTNVGANKTINFNYRTDEKSKNKAEIPEEYLLVKNDSVQFDKHIEQSSLDFNKQILSPFAYSNLGPKVSIGDLNGDGLEDVVIGGGKTQTLQVWYQQAFKKFIKDTSSIFKDHVISENTAQLLLDVENDGDMDIIVVSGGNEFKSGIAIQPKLYLNTGDGFILDSLNFKNTILNASSITKVDFNNDGFEDVFISANIIPGKIGENPAPFLFKNDGKGNFKDFSAQILPQNVGMIQDVKWRDMNADGYKDLITVGHWTAPTIYLNIKGERFEEFKTNLSDYSGWWNTLEMADLDNDGDLDIVAGNWGLNTRLKASGDEPVTMYLNDFDENGTQEPVITYFYDQTETVFSSKDELDQQLPFLKKKFTTYRAFAEADFSTIFPKDKIENALIKEVTELGSSYFENVGNGNFKMRRLPLQAQVSTVFAIEISDFNNDGFEDILLAGNNYEISTQLGRLDASHGSLLLNDGKGNFSVASTLTNIAGAARDIAGICIDNKQHFIITFNNGTPLILKSN